MRMKNNDEPNDSEEKPNNDNLDINYFEKKFNDISNQLECIQRAIAHHRRDTAPLRHFNRSLNEVKKE